MPYIPPLLVSIASLAAAVAFWTLPMPVYIRRSLTLMLAWFGVSYAIIYFFDLDTISALMLGRFNLILLFLIIVACAVAWHAGGKTKWNK